MKTTPKKNGGFTLVELIVVIAILAILAAVAIPAYSGYIAKAEKANDLQLLGAVNQAFGAACVENNIFDMTTVEGTVISLDSNGYIVGMNVKESLSNAPTIDTTGNPVLASFIRYYGDNINTPFKYFHTKLTYGPDGFDGLEPGQKDTGIIGKLFDTLLGNGTITQDQIGAVNKSEFGQIGSEEMLNKVTGVTDYAANLASTNLANGYANASNFLYSNMDAMADAMGYDLDDEKESEAFFAWLEESAAKMAAEKGWDDPKMAEHQMLANYAVLAAAGATTGTADELLVDVQKGMTGNDLKGMLDSADGAQNGLAKAGMMYGLYTAWANGLDENDPDKAEAMANAADINKFLEDVDNTRFVDEYLNGKDSTAKTDLEGYLAAMDIINASVQNGDSATVTDLLYNGYDTDTMKNALEQLLGQ